MELNWSFLIFTSPFSTLSFVKFLNDERGLYFPNAWSKEYVPILSMNDKGESPKQGSLLIAKYGKGNYVYTGVSFFRELPAGVSGAYKLFTNLLSLKKHKS